MSFLKSEVNAGPNNVIRVDIDSQANVVLMDSQNFRAYQNGRPYRGYGGWAKQSPVCLRPPCQGKWYVVVHLGGAAGRVRAGVRVINT